MLKSKISNWIKLKKMTDSRLKLYNVVLYNGKITFHTSRAIRNNGIVIDYQITVFVDPMKILIPWIGKEWIWKRESQMDMQYSEFIHLYPKDTTKNIVDLWNETLGKRLSEVFDFDLIKI